MQMQGATIVDLQYYNALTYAVVLLTHSKTTQVVDMSAVSNCTDCFITSECLIEPNVYPIVLIRQIRRVHQIIMLHVNLE